MITPGIIYFQGLHPDIRRDRGDPRAWPAADKEQDQDRVRQGAEGPHHGHHRRQRVPRRHRRTEDLHFPVQEQGTNKKL